ncbi:hypothetical protein ACVWY0_001251 [Arthrobacter sp. UYNi723]
MSSFDDLLGQYEQPSEVDIALPARAGSVGDKGGTNGTAPVGSPAESQAASTAPEPEPQLPEGSDAEDKAAAEEEEAAVAEAAAVQAAQQEKAAAEAEAAAADEALDGRDADDTDTDSDTSEPEADQPGSGAVQQSTPQPVIPRKGGGLSFEGESAYLKQFPRILIDQMRESLKSQVGDAFARDISQVSIVTAFVIAAMGAEIATDEFTEAAVKAFRANDPKTDAIEKRTATLLEQQAKSDAMLKKISEKLGEVADTAAVLEMGQAYALAERTAHLDTEGALPETIDVTQKRAVASRDNIRKRVKIQQREEKVRAGRPIR